MTVEECPFTQSSTVIYRDPTKEGLYLVNGVYMVGLSESELSKLSKAIEELKNQNEAVSKLRESIKDDIDYIMEKTAKCNNDFKLRNILDELEKITAEI